MCLHRLFIFILIIMALFSLNLDWFYHSYNNNLINPSFMDRPVSKPFWGDLFLYGSGAFYTLLGLFVIFTPKQVFLTRVTLRLAMLVISLQVLLGLLLIFLQSNDCTFSSANVNFILFLMINLALFKRFLSFCSASSPS